MRIVLSGLLCFFLVQIAWSSAPQDSIGMTKQEGKFFLKYLVAPGETIYRISTKYGIPVSDLLELNPALENGLKTGQVLLIPFAPEKKPAPELDDNQYHVVDKGETFFSIARKYNIPVGDLLKANNIELKTGQKIIVKKGALSANKLAEDNVSATSFNSVSSSLPTTPKTESKTVSPKAEPKTETVTTPQTSTKEEKHVVQITDTEQPKALETSTPASSEGYADYINSTKRVLVIPFDPYLYFSDADDEIAGVSHIHRTKVRQAFRKRLNAYLEPKGFETIHLLGGTVKDSTTDLNRIYSSISYTYDNVMMTGLRPEDQIAMQSAQGNAKKENKKNMPVPNHPPTLQSRANLAKDDGKYFAVRIKDPNFFPFFDTKYKPDYYIFVSQFEVKTNYENCLDRARQNYERTFISHFSIFDKSGAQISGGRLKSNYESGTNNLEKILADNIPPMADRIIAELPK